MKRFKGYLNFNMVGETNALYKKSPLFLNKYKNLINTAIIKT